MNFKIIPFENQYTKDFYHLNIEWLEALFKVEAYDKKVLSQPQQYIIDTGGYIFLGRKDDVIIGTVALMPIINSNYFELTKMAVSPKYRGLKIGQTMMEHVIEFAKTKQIPKLIICSSTKLENAIYIYKKYGFVEIPMEPNNHYERSDIKMELFLMRS
ncbi:GNAT family N-acetyltransferase [Algibacter miyuki]|uniref:GNAT family N-acetyltransferase n=1 Tax=Algibacter miyuki TaxID=1306933 RepID=A0ABV5H374_9FLAO|nr:GNAT family N-acetyltransferase [Algibacter miyuki]MDN3665415.1 GNAT family N-acetyltransferase [Algibacter miyuki]